jgi:hypothetical protein
MYLKHIMSLGTSNIIIFSCMFFRVNYLYAHALTIFIKDAR